MNLVHELPEWLDTFVFEKLEAQYFCSRETLTILDMDVSQLLNYVGTYFPRSYGESRGIMSNAIEKNFFDTEKSSLQIFDFGCGSGGEIIGLLDALNERCKNLKSVTITAFDGNKKHLALFSLLITEAKKHYSFDIVCDLKYYVVEKQSDLEKISVFLEKNKGAFDILISFKALSEFLNKGYLEGRNPYLIFTSTFFKHLAKGGLFILGDLTYKDYATNQWLSDKQKKVSAQFSDYVVDENEGWYSVFSVSHSRMKGDTSKLAWRILKSA